MFVAIPPFGRVRPNCNITCLCFTTFDFQMTPWSDNVGPSPGSQQPAMLCAEPEMPHDRARLARPEPGKLGRVNLDRRQLARIEAVHRGFLYQHLYAVACLFRASSAGVTHIVVENDEDAIEGRLKGAKQSFAGLRRGHAARGSGQQSHAETPLQPVDRMAESGLRAHPGTSESNIRQVQKRAALGFPGESLAL